MLSSMIAARSALSPNQEELAQLNMAKHLLQNMGVGMHNTPSPIPPQQQQQRYHHHHQQQKQQQQQQRVAKSTNGFTTATVTPARPPPSHPPSLSNRLAALMMGPKRGLAARF
eukprot:scaffold380280_cov31-Prasinocladus_malaysianus.AAC.2